MIDIEKLADEKYPYKLSSRARKAGFIEGFKAAEEISIEFAEWRDNKLEELNKWILDGVPMGNKFTTQELYQDFLKTKTL